MDLYLLCLIIIISSWFISSWNFFKIINVTSISITYKYIVLNKNILYINNKLNFIFNLENEYSVHIYDKFKYTWRRHWESKRRYQLSKGTARRTCQEWRHLFHWFFTHFIDFWKSKQKPRLLLLLVLKLNFATIYNICIHIIYFFFK